jgi:hypothetical protein
VAQTIAFNLTLEGAMSKLRLGGVVRHFCLYVKKGTTAGPCPVRQQFKSDPSGYGARR